MSTDACFSMGCIDDPASDRCGECGRYTGAKSRAVENRKETVESAVDKAWEKSNEPD